MARIQDLGRRKGRKQTGDALVDEMMAQFDHGYINALDRFEVFERIQQAYDNNINSGLWPAISEIGFPITFTSVEEQLPFAMKYLYPNNRFINLIPQNQILDVDSVEGIENDLRYTIKNKMQAETATLPSVKDCYKFGVGYGLIDTEWVTPPQVMNNILSQNGNVVESVPQMVMGKPIQQVVYKYLSIIQVIPMPDGANVDGPNRASGHFVIELIPESIFRDMYEEKDSEGNPFYKGDIEKIVNEARHLNYDSRMLPPDIIHQLAGFNLPIVNDADRRIPVTIPVIKAYFQHEQVWIANGTTLMRHVKDKYQTLMSDLVKFSAWPDGQRWFPMNITESAERLSAGINIWYNGMIDLAMYHLNPTRIINSKVIDHPDNIGRGPNSDIKVSGDVRQAVAYMDLPQFPQSLDNMGGILERFHGSANAQVRSVRDGQAGLVRGGTNALETLLSSSTGRQFLAAIVLKSGAIKPMIEKTLIKKQLLIDQAGSRFIQSQPNPDTGVRTFIENHVTLEDMRNIFEVELDMPAARLNSAASLSERTAFFDRAERKPELFDQIRLYEELTEDHAMVERVMKPKNVVREREDRMAEARLRAAELGQALPEDAGGPSTQADQGLAGAANLGGQA